MSKPTTKVDAEKLLASMSGKPTSDSVKKALESLKEQQNKEQREKLGWIVSISKFLHSLQSNTGSMVSCLRCLLLY